MVYHCTNSLLSLHIFNLSLHISLYVFWLINSVQHSASNGHQRALVVLTGHMHHPRISEIQNCKKTLVVRQNKVISHTAGLKENIRKNTEHIVRNFLKPTLYITRIKFCVVFCINFCIYCTSFHFHLICLHFQKRDVLCIYLTCFLI